ncbi:MAG TPA: alanine--tRNA ligase-related protein, partial [Thermoanaerobaculia bacterium]|nr:alanine--tRNA ligase-related protein [Thermoanaerobaculia bacterium]
RAQSKSTLPGAMVFRLSDTYGLPLEVIREIAAEERFGVDEEGFKKSLERQREQSRKATKETQNRLLALRDEIRGHADVPETRFEGWETTTLDGVGVARLAVWKDGDPMRVSEVKAGESGVAVLDQTVFYAEGGGEVGDTGQLLWDGGRAQVTDTRKDISGVFYHFVEVERGTLSRHLKVDLRVDFERRHAIERNHTATHLLHAALRQVLGASARQAGSLVAPDRLRFDFTYHRGMLEPEIRQVEDLVNEWIRRAVATDFRFRSYQEAVAAGAMALFGEKYADVVRTVEVPGFSLELCGGCHVGNTGQIGLFLIESERGIASGVRRIEAVTGTGALDAVRDQRAAYDGLIDALGIKAADAVQQRERAAQLRARQTELETEVRKLRLQLVSGGGGASGTDDETIDVEGVRLLAREVPPAPADDLRAMADALRSKLGSGVVILGAREDGNVSLIAAVTKDLTERVRAGELVKKLSAIVGGRGGGRADFAQAGGKQPENLPAALAAAGDAVREQLAGVKT